MTIMQISQEARTHVVARNPRHPNAATRQDVRVNRHFDVYDRFGRIVDSGWFLESRSSVYREDDNVRVRLENGTECYFWLADMGIIWKSDVGRWDEKHFTLVD